MFSGGGDWHAKQMPGILFGMTGPVQDKMPGILCCSNAFMQTKLQAIFDAAASGLRLST
jgi:hypothetical protein